MIEQHDENQPSGPVTQNNIETQGGDYAGGNIDKRSGAFYSETNISSASDLNINGDAIGRDKITNIYQVISPHLTPLLADDPPASGEPPFKGLQYFNEADANLFFGRELLTAKLAGHLRQHRFLAVVGASGSGKSSVVRAGLVPALKRGEPLADGALPPESSGRWSIHILTPTAHPLEALAASLTRDSESVTATTTLIDDLTSDPRSLHLAVRRALNRQSRERLLLIVDQFEELFTLCRSEVERKLFVDNLLNACAPETEGPTIVVITLRADFYAHCAQYTNLREVLAKWQEYIGLMSAKELRLAIEEPAKRNGWEFEPGLVDLFLRDVGFTHDDAGSGEPGALPLLSHALLETWKRRSGRRLTLKGYDESGGVRGAIAKTAETVYQQLTPEQQTIARSIFLRLTELGEGTQDTRRRAALTELIPRPEDKAAVEAVLKTLSDARLIMTEEETADVAHEALIREWPTLRRWLDEDRRGLQIHRRLTEAAQEWADLNRDPGKLYRGRLAVATDWAKDHADELNALEREFLTASLKLRETVRQAKQKEKLWPSLIGGLIGGGLGGSGGALISYFVSGQQAIDSSGANLGGFILGSFILGALFGFTIALGISLDRWLNRQRRNLPIIGGALAGMLPGMLLGVSFSSHSGNSHALSGILIGGFFGLGIGLSFALGKGMKSLAARSIIGMSFGIPLVLILGEVYLYFGAAVGCGIAFGMGVIDNRFEAKEVVGLTE